MVITINNLKEAAIAYWRLQKWVSSIEVDRKIAAESSLRTLKDFLKENEVEVIDLTGKLYDPGLSVEVMYFEDEDTVSENIPTIVEMMKPIIIQKGSVIEFGQVVIAKNPQNILAQEPELIATTENIVDEDEQQVALPKKEKSKIISLVSILSSVVTCLMIVAFFVIQAKNAESKSISILKSQSELRTEFDQYKDDMSKKLTEIQSSISIPATETDADVDANSIGWQAYIIKSGDTLTSVCIKYNIDFNAWEKVILSTNGIEDSNKIYVGQALLLPVQTKGR
ncbi:MAG: LysM peptidoglycan-binding domain-containing protein [Dysgonamonadaceae bacterium]|nr:LysM peptidoglycan-binding domain-containing protein [Dysgonamonadaceae bacterium]